MNKPLMFSLFSSLVIISIAVFLLIYPSNQIELEQNIIEKQSSPSISFTNTTVPIKVGIIHSLTGTMAISESKVVDTTLLAIDEINSRGGILGREVIPIIKDGRSNSNVFAQEVKSLIEDDKVDVVFGGWTSASRKTMKPIFEQQNHLLFYPVQYEGLESSPNIVYTGASPNQQALPAVEWAYENLGTKFYLVGSDYVFPRSVNEIIKDKVHSLGGTIVGEKYRLLGSNNFKGIVDDILESKPDVILNSINGDSNLWFFQELYERNITADEIPVISFSIAENEIKHMDSEIISGHYASWNYFQSVQSTFNKNFVDRFQQKYGLERVLDDPMEAGYVNVYLYAKAVELAGTTNIPDVINEIRGITINAPGSTVGIDPQNLHAKKISRIGQVQSDGQFRIVFSSESPIEPIPYPESKTYEEWELFLSNLYEEWDQSWSNKENQS